MEIEVRTSRRTSAVSATFRNWRISSPIIRNALAAIAIGYALLLTFPVQAPSNSWVNEAGLDASWQYALNSLAQSGYRFGTDVAFTWGPLGYLAVPIELGSNVVTALAFWLATHLVFAVALILYYLRNRNALALVVFSIGYGLALSLESLVDYHLLILLAMLVSFSPTDGRTWKWLAALGAILSAVLLFMKFSTGIAAIAMLGTAGTIWWLEASARRWQVSSLTAGVFAVASGLLAFTLLGGVRSTGRWLYASVDGTQAYASAMSAPGPTLAVILGIGAIVVYLGLLVHNYFRDRAGFNRALVFVGPLFVTFRHAYVRHQGRLFFPILVGFLAVLALSAPNWKRMVAPVSAGLLVLAAGVGASFLYECDCRWSPSRLSPKVGSENLTMVVRLESARREAASASQHLLGPDRLPKAWIQRIGNSTVDVLPSEINLVAANGLNWRPNPSIQLYAATTAHLDKWVARHFDGPSAPDWLIVAWGDIDARHPILSQPRTWRSILSRYEVELVDEILGRVLLQRQRGDSLEQIRTRGKSRELIESWIEVPQSDELQFASLVMNPNLRGRIASLMWRIPPVYIDFQYRDGAVGRNRLLPGTVGGGLLLSNLPFEFKDFVNLLEGQMARSLARFRITGPGSSFYGPEIEIGWYEVEDIRASLRPVN